MSTRTQNTQPADGDGENEEPQWAYLFKIGAAEAASKGNARATAEFKAMYERERRKRRKTTRRTKSNNLPSVPPGGRSEPAG